jgi:hypothetical protein
VAFLEQKILLIGKHLMPINNIKHKNLNYIKPHINYNLISLEKITEKLLLADRARSPTSELYFYVLVQN